MFWFTVQLLQWTCEMVCSRAIILTRISECLGLKLIYKYLTQNWSSFHDHFRTENETIESLCFMLKGTSRDDLIQRPAQTRTCFDKVLSETSYFLQGWRFHSLFQQPVLQLYGRAVISFSLTFTHNFLCYVLCLLPLTLSLWTCRESVAFLPWTLPLGVWRQQEEFFLDLNIPAVLISPCHSSGQSCAPLPDSLQNHHVLQNPRLDMALKMWSHNCWAEGNTHLSLLSRLAYIHGRGWHLLLQGLTVDSCLHRKTMFQYVCPKLVLVPETHLSQKYSSEFACAEVHVSDKPGLVCGSLAFWCVLVAPTNLIQFQTYWGCSILLFKPLMKILSHNDPWGVPFSEELVRFCTNPLRLVI